MLGPNALSPGLYNGILQFKRSMISRVISLHRPNLSQQRLNWDLITKNPLWIQLGSAGLLLQHLDDNILFPTELYIANIEWSPCMCQYSVLFKEDMLHVLMAFNREKIVRQHLLVKNQFTVRHNGSFLLIGYTFICNIQCYCNVCWLETSDLGTCVFQSSKVTLRSTVDQSLSSGLSRTHPCSSRHGRIYVENIRSSCLRKKKKVTTHWILHTIEDILSLQRELELAPGRTWRRSKDQTPVIFSPDPCKEVAACSCLRQYTWAFHLKFPYTSHGSYISVKISVKA